MTFLKRYSITFQLFLFISFVVFLIFGSSTVIVYNYQKSLITRQNSDYLNNHVESFNSQLNLAYEGMQGNVNEGINIADMVFYRNYSGLIQVNEEKKITYHAVNQITHDTNLVIVNEWSMDGQLINNNYHIVDKIRDLGPATVTIFQKFEYGYLRISTNVINKAGQRAVGTYIPFESDVIKSIENGDRFQGRAFVVDDWYTTIYDPIYIHGEIQGMLYVGERENNVNVINKEEREKRYLKDGYGFVMSDNMKFEGLMMMHPTLEGINIKTSGDYQNLELYNQLISNHSINKENAITQIRLKDTKLGDDVLVYYSYHPIFHYYFGIIVPYSSYIQNELNSLLKVMFWRFVIGLPIAVILVFAFTFLYKKRLGRLIYSLHQLGKGIVPKPIRVDGKDEIAQTAKFINSLARGKQELITQVQQVEKGEYGVKVRVKSDRDQLAISFNNMSQKLQDLEAKHNHQLMMREAENDLFERTRFSSDLEKYCDDALYSINKFLPVQLACLYTFSSDSNLLQYRASIGLDHQAEHMDIPLGSGLIGEAAAEPDKIKVIDNIPKGFYRINTGIGKAEPTQILIVPLVLSETLLGVLELASFTTFTIRDFDLLEVYKDSLAISLNMTISRIETQALLEQIQVQTEELRVTNDTLEKQANSLQVSEENLQVQQEELRVTNEELELQAQSLMKSEHEMTRHKEALDE
ncbi:MAG: GAF domain-containing protein, partial [Bacteroidales bacterium]|nr:GAF domain-containing protein [Bacteroidales bacterium]